MPGWSKWKRQKIRRGRISHRRGCESGTEGFICRFSAGWPTEIYTSRFLLVLKGNKQFYIFSCDVVSVQNQQLIASLTRIRSPVKRPTSNNKLKWGSDQTLLTFDSPCFVAFFRPSKCQVDENIWVLAPLLISNFVVLSRSLEMGFRPLSRESDDGDGKVFKVENKGRSPSPRGLCGGLLCLGC